MRNPPFIFVGAAGIDQSVIDPSIAFRLVRTGPIGYVQMHRRNGGAWFPSGDWKQADKNIAIQDLNTYIALGRRHDTAEKRGIPYNRSKGI